MTPNPSEVNAVFLKLLDSPKLQVVQDACTAYIRVKTSTCCRKHWEEANAHHAVFSPQGIDWIPASPPFITCTVCGNKRCPRATDCSLPCTGSNEPGQPGSVY